jgi:1-acyl-sn-glycerol-3-phosphate acyltransferase
MTPWWVRLSRRRRRRQLFTKQQLVGVDCAGTENIQDSLSRGCGLLVTPNHSAHYDSAALYVAADRIDTPLFFMAAWQVFAMANKFERWAMQRLGCFSIDRESSDRSAFKQSIEILRSEPYPLVIFPEGDIYHTADRVTPFREGAAAIALSASKRATRPVEVIPCGIRFSFVDDPSEPLRASLDEIERRLRLRPANSTPLVDRVHRVAEAALALKEIDYMGESRTGRLRDRIGRLSEDILQRLEAAHEISGRGTTPERVKTLRAALIAAIEKCESENRPGDADDYFLQMHDLFFVMQLFSYPGEYLVEDPTLERVAETVDKFEEDILQRDLPRVRGRRRVRICFGEPVSVEPGGRDAVAQLSATMQERVQGLVDGLRPDGERGE